jgi:hypothetical protein
MATGRADRLRLAGTEGHAFSLFPCHQHRPHRMDMVVLNMVPASCSQRSEIDDYTVPAVPAD